MANPLFDITYANGFIKNKKIPFHGKWKGKLNAGCCV